MTPWAQLLALAERERDLAAAGRWEELVTAGAERAAFAATLRAATPEARPYLDRVVGVQEELTQLILAARTETLRELSDVRRGQGAVRGYAAASAGRGGWVDESS